MKIRKAKKEDLKAISEIFRIETAKKPYFQKWTEASALEKINDFFKNNEIYVVEVGKEIVGFIVLVLDRKKKNVHVEELWLKKGSQGKGIGKNLMKFVEQKYKKKGFKKFGLVANQEARAVNFYKNLNYKVKQKLLYMAKRL